MVSASHGRKTDGGVGSERTCAVTRAPGSPEAMLRFVRGPDGKVTPDVARRLPGRGVWLTAQRDIVARAVAGKTFSRAFKAPAEASPDLPDEVDAMLERDALQWLSLANKAGQIVAGFAKVEAVLARGDAIALLHARDGGADGRGKLDRIALRAAGARPPLILAGIFDSVQMSLALGRPHVVHAALTAGPVAQTLLGRCRRLGKFRGTPFGDIADTAESPAHVSAPDGDLNLESQLSKDGLGPGISNE